MYYVQSALLVLLLMSVSTAVPAAEAESLPGLCDSCHGSLGVSSDSDVPTIAGQAAAYISATLELYQDWGRPCLKSAFRHGDTSKPETTMCKVSEGLAPADIETLSQHYQAQTFVSAQQDFDAAKAETGGDLHEIHCETCHPMGGSMAGRGPRLAGQWVPYLRMAMSQALSGEHLVPPVMEERLTDFSVDDIDALLNFYASQQN